MKQTSVQRVHRRSPQPGWQRGFAVTGPEVNLRASNGKTRNDESNTRTSLMRELGVDATLKCPVKVKCQLWEEQHSRGIVSPEE